MTGFSAGIRSPQLGNRPPGRGTAHFPLWAPSTAAIRPCRAPLSTRHMPVVWPVAACVACSKVASVNDASPAGTPCTGRLALSAKMAPTSRARQAMFYARDGWRIIPARVFLLSTPVLCPEFLERSCDLAPCRRESCPPGRLSGPTPGTCVSIALGMATQRLHRLGREAHPPSSTRCDPPSPPWPPVFLSCWLPLCTF